MHHTKYLQYLQQYVIALVENMTALGQIEENLFKALKKGALVSGRSCGICVALVMLICELNIGWGCRFAAIYLVVNYAILDPIIFISHGC